MRTRSVASENESGLEKAERSASSAQGRRWSRPWRREADRWLMKARKAGLLAGASDTTAPGPPAAAGWALEIGRTGGAVEDMVLERERYVTGFSL